MNKIPDHAEKVFNGVIFDVYQWEQELFNGQKAIFERIRRPSTTEVIAVMDDKILIQFQEQPACPPFLSLPGGRVDEGQTVFENAQSELLEETGYQAQEWIEYKMVQPVGKIDWTIAVYIARGLTCVQDLCLDGGEKIELKWVTFDELLDLVDSGELHNIEFELRTELIRAKYHQESYDKMKQIIFGA